MLKTLAFILIASASSRSIRDLEIPFNGNVYDYLDDNFGKPLVTATATTATDLVFGDLSTPSGDLSTPSSTTTTTGGYGFSVISAAFEDTTTAAPSSSTTAASEKVVVRVFHSSDTLNINNNHPQLKNSDINKLAAVLDDIKFLTRKQSDEIGKLRTEEIARLREDVNNLVSNSRIGDEMRAVEIKSLRDDLNGLVKAIPSLEKHLRNEVVLIMQNISHGRREIDDSTIKPPPIEEPTAWESHGR